MARLCACLGFALFLLTASSCIFFTAESDFYFDNRTSHSLAVSWVNDEDKTESLVVAVNGKELLKNSVMGETNRIKPSHVLKSLQATAEIGGAVTLVYAQDPIDDSVWKRTNGSKDQYYIYTLQLTDADLKIGDPNAKTDRL